MTAPRSYQHRGGLVPLLGDTIDERFRAVVREHGDREALVSLHPEVRRTYRALDAEVERAARGLATIGARTGTMVGIWATDRLEWLVTALAAARIGAIFVNINPAYRVAELRFALALAEDAGMIGELVPALGHTAPGEWRSETLPALRDVIQFAPASGSAARPAAGTRARDQVLAAGMAVAPSYEPPADCDLPVNIQFTSGTTGAPKAVVLTHHNILNNAWSVGEAMRFTPEDRLCVPVPFYHCFGLVVSALVCLSRGATLIVPAPHFEAGATLEAIERERATAVHGVPTMFIAELEALAARPRDLSSLRTGIMAGAPCPPELVRRVADELGCREILIGYGQTEASPVTHLTRAEDSFERRVGTVGTNLPHQEVKVIDPATGRTVPRGEPGELCFRGYHVMRGYYRQEEATRKTIDAAGWLHSGDIGAMDAEGYCRITGRLKDMIIRGGEKIYPAEIEAFYFAHPAIADIAVFGIPDERMGERVAAWVALHEGARAGAEELRAFAKGRIAHYKIPELIRIVREFPMTVTGKVQKFRMREIEAAGGPETPPAPSEGGRRAAR
jgi:fatty-acyl-CoA synthase